MDSDGPGCQSRSWQRTPFSSCWLHSYETSTSSSWTGSTQKLENDENLDDEKKLEIQQTIDSLNEEQQHQIATIEDEFNRKIIEKISEFKLNTFKNNSGIQLLEEQLKLNIYALINDSFYW